MTIEGGKEASLVEKVNRASEGAARAYLGSAASRGASQGEAFLAGVAWVISDPGFVGLESALAEANAANKRLMTDILQALSSSHGGGNG